MTPSVQNDAIRLVFQTQTTWDLLTDRYSVRNNLVLQFKRDTIDQSPQLAETLFNRFGRDGELEFSRRVFCAGKRSQASTQTKGVRVRAGDCCMLHLGGFRSIWGFGFFRFDPKRRLYLFSNEWGVHLNQEKAWPQAAFEVLEIACLPRGLFVYVSLSSSPPILSLSPSRV